MIVLPEVLVQLKVVILVLIKTRGATHLKKVFLGRNTLGKKPVQFDGMHPLGPTGAELSSYAALVARINVSITIKSWGNVPMDTKENVWEEIMVTFFDI